ncbi:phosphomannose isomerase type II C-terminal cupin domain [Methylobacterium isbiliense]|uniref:Mannose-6-phosphate isomerase type II C-terminal domain-containing protein n=1 Tax=Methylobacterium isbiliense TaxID=315478 RepID=A0ABQ4SCT9_9HYPH|nr:phosphomannose isomerase type II C-terminal cupin domain [Methylobacterium isbiliense]MDN3621871.1 phosphomannose isomerase type II C-terminal cupin domain [Methylobacterium isbiliense]GJD99614.1 hypothetical protein GMJLKIPL_1532 [Methylobacterium isbiliense]
MTLALTPQAFASAGAVTYQPGDRDCRPWGTWEVLATGPGYTVKRITVTPGQRLSLQYHNHRAEHWTIVSGSADVEIDDRVLHLAQGEHVHIPLKATHRIRNAGQDDMVFIEVQYGALLDENDIVRVTDDYGRCVPA